MRMLLVLVQIAVLASIARAGEEAAEEKEAIRQRLVEAFDAQPVRHHALRWRIKHSEGGDLDFFTEYLQEGDRAGIRAVIQEGDRPQQEHALMVTDGETVQATREGSSFSLEGERPLNRSLSHSTGDGDGVDPLEVASRDQAPLRGQGPGGGHPARVAHPGHGAQCAPPERDEGGPGSPLQHVEGQRPDPCSRGDRPRLLGSGTPRRGYR